MIFLIAGSSAYAIDKTDCDGNVLDDSTFSEAVVRDHTDQSYGALSNSKVRPLGGGEGYSNIVPRSAKGVVRTATELQAALLAAVRAPKTIYVDDGAEINLSYCARIPTPSACSYPEAGPLDCGDFTLSIPSNTTLASGRGRVGSRGARLFSHTFTDCPLFAVADEGVRITGLRIHGPDSSIDNDELIHCGGEASAIAIKSFDALPLRWNTEIDNDELSSWPRAGVEVHNIFGVRFHHNVVQYNRRFEHNFTCGAHNYGLGYGIVVGPGSATIEANLFDHNRHDIASDGTPGSFYTATYNLVLTGAVGQNFDVHGGKDRKDCTSIAGSAFVIHHNTFLQSQKPAVLIRGVPMKGAWMYKNTTIDNNAVSAFSQVNSGGNFHRSDNRLKISEFPAWFISFAGSSFWQWRRFDGQGMSGSAIGDFDGDGAADVMRAVPNQWLWSRSARENWQFLNTSKVPVSKLRFGDFVGLRNTDIVRDADSEWQVSESGMSAWRSLFATPKSFTDAEFGDFEGDSKTDVFFADGAQWSIVISYSPRITRHYTQRYKLDELRFGNFVGDSKTDVLRAQGNDWLVWDHVSQAWVQLNSAPMKLANQPPSNIRVFVPIPLNEMTLADFDGDGVTDIARNAGDKWLVSWGGASTWKILNYSDLALKSQLIGDFNGDRKADVLSRQSPDP